MYVTFSCSAFFVTFCSFFVFLFFYLLSLSHFMFLCILRYFFLLPYIILFCSLFSVSASHHFPLRAKLSFVASSTKNWMHRQLGIKDALADLDAYEYECMPCMYICMYISSSSFLTELNFLFWGARVQAPLIYVRVYIWHICNAYQSI
jgi:hypothetical protein